MNYENVKEQLQEILRIDFNSIEKNELEDVINGMFLLYRGFINESCDILNEKQSRQRSMFNPPGKEKEELKGRIELDEIKTRLEGNVLFSYAYGAYISNKIAHLFDMMEGFSIGKNPITNHIIAFSDEFADESRKTDLRKKAFALKTMFIQKTIEESGNNHKNNITWTKDESGITVLNVNITNYSLKKMQEYHNYPDDIIISIHVVDTKLADALQTLSKRDDYQLRGSKPIDILDGKIYEELQEEK